MILAEEKQHCLKLLGGQSFAVWRCQQRQQINAHHVLYLGAYRAINSLYLVHYTLHFLTHVEKGGSFHKDVCNLRILLPATSERQTRRVYSVCARTSLKKKNPTLPCNLSGVKLSAVLWRYSCRKLVIMSTIAVQRDFRPFQPVSLAGRISFTMPAEHLSCGTCFAASVNLQFHVSFQERSFIPRWLSSLRQEPFASLFWSNNSFSQFSSLSNRTSISRAFCLLKSLPNKQTKHFILSFELKYSPSANSIFKFNQQLQAEIINCTDVGEDCLLSFHRKNVLNSDCTMECLQAEENGIRIKRTNFRSAEMWSK